MSTLKFWLDNARKTSLVQSFMPAVVAVSLAWGQDGFCLPLAIAAIVGVMAAHLGMNLADDYFDYKANSSETRKNLVRQGFRARIVKYPYLTDGKATLKDLKRAIVLFLAFAAVLGGVIMAFNPSWQIVIIALLTLFFGIFYSAAPFKLSYHGLGELVIGFIFGPLLMSGIYAASTGSMSLSVLFVSVPVGLLVVNILFTHSFIDRIADEASGKRTLAVVLDSNRANMTASVLFNTLPFVIIIVAVVLGFLHPMYLLTLIALPRAIWLLHSLKLFIRNKPIDFSKPRPYLGRMENREKIIASGIDWFMIRWYCARNTTSAFCLAIIIVNIILLWF